jgi:hypothetical protein
MSTGNGASGFRVKPFPQAPSLYFLRYNLCHTFSQVFGERISLPGGRVEVGYHWPLAGGRLLLILRVAVKLPLGAVFLL